MSKNGKAHSMSHPHISEVRNALPQIIAVTVKNILLMGYGMTIGYPTILIPSLSQRKAGEDIYLNQEEISWIGSINLMCVPIGCFFSGMITQPLGRKRTMQIICVPFIICWVMFKYCDEAWQIYLALGLTGLSGGLLEAPVLTYVAEVTQPHLRGLLSATSTMSIFLGVFLEFFMGAFMHWRNVAVYSCIIPAAAFICLFFIPESPHWYMIKNKFGEARKSLAWLRGWTSIQSIEAEFQELTLVKQAQQLQGTIKKDKLIQQYTKRRFLCPLALVSFVFFLAHFCGITAFQTYAVKIFATLRVPIDEYYATILLGIAQFLGCLTCVALVHFLGKRILTFCTLILAIICVTATATYAYLIDVLYFDSNTEVKDMGNYKWIPLICLVLAAFMIQSGIRTLPWILVGEVFSRDTRAFGAGLLAAIGYIFGFATNKIFLQTVSAITLPGTFWLFAGISLVGLIVLFFWLPETEGKSLLEITEHFAGKSKLDNKVCRKRHHTGENGYTNAAFDCKTADFAVNGNTDSRL